MNISNFMTWFLNQFYNIGTTMLAKLDQITLIGNVTLMQFIITIAIISTFVELLVVAPRLGIVNRTLSANERKNRQKGGNK